MGMKQELTENRIGQETCTGIFLANAKGYGFVEIAGQKEDLFVPPGMTGGACHRDLVEVALLAACPGKRTEAAVVRILERGIKKLVGTFERSKSFGFVKPDDPHFSRDIFIPAERAKGAVTGHKVVAELTDYGGNGRNPEGRIVEILGHVNDPGVDILSVIKGYELPVEFSEKVLAQADRVASEVSEADRAGRRDLRSVCMVTIDGEDAKDLDDAVSLSYDEASKRYLLGVHIADVANYVQENSALDREAKKRGNSVYLVDRVIPMLPHVLSNGMCSLNEGEDRLALSCMMEIDGEGRIADYEIAETVIRVDKRLSYAQVRKILEEQAEEEQTPFKELVPMLKKMAELSALLRDRRKKRGAVDFEFSESKILLDQKGHPVEILPYERNVATMLIEDFMLAANETIAQHFYWQELPFVYRVHEKPDAEKMSRLNAFLNNLGYYMKAVGRGRRRVSDEEIHPKELQKILEKVRETPMEALVSRLVLRSMKQAHYSVENTGHFGLACDFYCHFTSPIRRYPDLQLHRIIKDQLRGRLTEKKLQHYLTILPEVAVHSSETERRANEAERETEKQKKLEYMEERIGEEYAGTISGITAWGIYVELPNTVEGMISVAKLPGDYFLYDENTYELVGAHTGQTFCLGKPVRVRMAGTDRMTKSVEFELVVEEEDEQGNGEAGCKQ